MNTTSLYQKERVNVINHANEDVGVLGNTTAKNLVKPTVPHSVPEEDVLARDQENAATCFVRVDVLALLKKTALLAKTSTMMVCVKKNVHPCKDTIQSTTFGSKTLMEDMLMVLLV